MTQQTKVMIIFSLNFQTNITAQMPSIGRKGPKNGKFIFSHSATEMTERVSK